jgi:dihydrofolate synthase/folylpolyglutamate synthase
LSRAAETETILLEARSLDRRLTYFELITACAFLYFAEQKIDVAVVEVGLGGALDATNVVVASVSVITGISYDHQELLGITLRAIAREKAGIIKEGTPVVSGCRQPEVRAVVRRAAGRASAPLYEVGRLYRIDRPGTAPRTCFSVATPSGWIEHLRPGLVGRHQARNAALATVAVTQLEQFPVTIAEIRRGLARTRWPGRLEEFRKPARTLVDGAHNQEGAATLRAYLLRHDIGAIHLVFGVLKDKDISGMIRCLFPVARRIYLVPLLNRRSADPFAVFALAPRFGRRISIYPDSRSALEAASRECGRDGTVVVAGSLYLVGEVLPLLRRLN